jgi:hypothetical protein
MLMSATPERLAGVAKGDVLDVALQEQQKTPVVVVSKDGKEVGSVGSGHLAQLIECLQEEHRYLADVLSLEGGACRVRIHHAGN